MIADIDLSPEDLANLAFLTGLKAVGYIDPRPIPNGRYACLAPFMFTYAIIVGRMGDDACYEDRWCYHTFEAAKAALEAWDGNGEPQGWHRHPITGRRRTDGDPTTEYVAP